MQAIIPTDKFNRAARLQKNYGVKDHVATSDYDCVRIEHKHLAACNSNAMIMVFHDGCTARKGHKTGSLHVRVNKPIPKKYPNLRITGHNVELLDKQDKPAGDTWKYVKSVDCRPSWKLFRYMPDTISDLDRTIHINPRLISLFYLPTDENDIVGVVLYTTSIEHPADPCAPLVIAPTSKIDPAQWIGIIMPMRGEHEEYDQAAEDVLTEAKKRL